MRNLAILAAGVVLILASCSDTSAPTTSSLPAASVTAPTVPSTSAPLQTTVPPPTTSSAPAPTSTTTSPATTTFPTTTTAPPPPPPCVDLAVRTEDAETVDGVLSLHNTTGVELWAVPLGTRSVTAFRLIEEVALVAFDDGFIGAVAVADCSLQWSIAVGSPAGEFLVDDDGTLIIVDGRNVSAHVPATGQEVWVQQWRSDPARLEHPAAAIADGTIALADSSRTTMARMFVDGQLASDSAALGEGGLTVVSGGGRFFSASDSGRIVAHPPVGQRIWETDLDMTGPVRITYDGGVLFAAGLGSVAALDTEDGSVRWQVDVAGDGEPAVFMAPGRMDHNELHVLDTTGRLHHLDRSDGSAIFTGTFPGGQTFPALEDKLVLVQRDGMVRAVNLLERARWEITTGANGIDRFTSVDVEGSLILAHTFSGERF